MAGFLVYDVLQTMQTVEVDPAKVGDLQALSSTREFEADGSNVVTVYENLDSGQRRILVDELAAIVPGITAIELARLADRQTLRFKQQTDSGVREFYAKQMSDGTLRALAILLAALQQSTRGLLVIEEPEIAIHLGALRTLVEMLQVQAERAQVIITTHSADIVDALPIHALRLVWSQGGRVTHSSDLGAFEGASAARPHHPWSTSPVGRVGPRGLMSARPTDPHVGLVVEGAGDRNALPVLLRSHLQSCMEYRDVLGKPVPLHGRDKAFVPNGIEGYVAVAAARPGCVGVLVVLDGRGDCVAERGTALLARGRSRSLDRMLVRFDELRAALPPAST